MLNDIYQGLDPIAFSLGPLVVRWYGLAYVLGFVCAAAIIYFVAKRWKLGMSEDNLLTLMVCAIVGVVLGARSVQKLQLIAGEIRSQGGQAAYCGVDVTNVDECRRLIETAVNEFGGIDVLVCNAGLSMRAIFDDVDLGVLHRLMDVNFWGTVNCCKFALPYLQRSRGSIVGISSVAGLHGLPGRTGYSASKYAMTGFLETLRIENLKKGLHVMIACPGFTASNVRFSALTADGSAQGETPRNEAKMMTSAEVARIVARGVLKRKRLCLMESEGRATHFVKKFAPGFLDRMFYLVMSKEPDSPLK